MIRTQPIAVKKTSKKSQLLHTKEQTTKSKTVKTNDNVKSVINNGKIIDKNDVKIVSKVQEPQRNKCVNQPSNQITVNSPKKLERSNSFSLGRKLTKIYNTIKKSKESLNNDVDDVDNASDKLRKPTFKFMRSVSLATITLPKDYRNSIRKPKLEQLSEEDANDWIDSSLKRNFENEEKIASTNTLDSLCSRTSDKSFMSSLKRTFSLRPKNKKKSTNPRWSASLLSLQQIDVMISYEDLSFIDYDKFNTYEETLKRHLSQHDVLSQPYRTNLINSTTKVQQQYNLNDNNHSNNEYFMEFPEVKMRTKQHDSSYPHRRHSTIVHQNSISNHCIDPDEFILNTSKRWSNPCAANENLLNSEGDVQYPSYAFVVGMNQCHDHGQCFNNSMQKMQSNDIETDSYDTKKRFKSVDDVLHENDEIDCCDKPASTVSEKTYFIHQFFILHVEWLTFGEKEFFHSKRVFMD